MQPDKNNGPLLVMMRLDSIEQIKGDNGGSGVVSQPIREEHKNPIVNNSNQGKDLLPSPGAQRTQGPLTPENQLAERQRQQRLQEQRREEQLQQGVQGPDPMTSPAAPVLTEMGYSTERVREAILAVRRQTGLITIMPYQALTWILDDEEQPSYRTADTTSQPQTSTGKKKNRRGKKGKGKPPTVAASLLGDAAPSDLDTRSLKEDNEKLREMLTCKICMERPVNTTFLPCGHLVCCEQCAPRLVKCPICRVRIKGTVKTFMS